MTEKNVTCCHGKGQTTTDEKIVEKFVKKNCF